MTVVLAVAIVVWRDGEKEEKNKNEAKENAMKMPIEEKKIK